MKVTALCVLALCVAAVCAVDRSKYPHGTFLDEEEKYELLWSVDRDAQTIRFAVIVQTTGWVGFGLSYNTDMGDSDIVIGWYENGVNHFDDRWALGMYEPPVDDQQDYMLLSMEESDGVMSMEFERDWNTCDDADLEIRTGTYHILYAYNDNDPITPSQIEQHQTMGMRAVNLLLGAISSVQLESDVEYFSITNTEAKVSETTDNAPTVYWCEPTRLPVGDFHMVQYEPVIQEGSEGFVHHMLVYVCDAEISDEDMQWSGPCDGYGMSDTLSSCRDGSPIAIWAVGAEAMYFPEGVGMPIPSGGVVLMEMHYDNNQQIPGIVDSSGMQIAYTPSKREHDAGVYVMGPSIGSIIVPPHVDKWIYQGECVPDCTQVSYPMNVFASALHTHTTGVAAYTEHFRGETQLPDIDRNMHYDFNNQMYGYIHTPIVIQPGDRMRTTCIYNTEDNRPSNYDKAVVGGWGTQEEMCLHYIMYYPAVPEIGGCGSERDVWGVDWQSNTATGHGLTEWLMTEFGATEAEAVTAVETYAFYGPWTSDGFQQILDSVGGEWNAKSTASFQDMYTTAPNYAYCNNELALQPLVYTPYVEPRTPCGTDHVVDDPPQPASNAAPKTTVVYILLAVCAVVGVVGGVAGYVYVKRGSGETPYVNGQFMMDSDSSFEDMEGFGAEDVKAGDESVSVSL